MAAKRAGYARDLIAAAVSASGLIWDEARGAGFLACDPGPYDDAYFDKYAAYDRMAMGRALTAFRVDFVTKRWRGGLVDVGIGSGAFVQAYGDLAAGYDVCPKAVAWLEAAKRFVNPFMQRVPAATFWDSLEHIEDFAPLLANIQFWAFISAPIYESAAHAVASKHFRPDEHFHYWTRRGLVAVMAQHGFMLRALSAEETTLGREGILTFAFARV